MLETRNRPVTVRPGRPQVRTTFQFTARIEPADKLSIDEAFGNARGVILDWLQSKFPAAIPDAARDGKSFGKEEHGQTLHGVSISEDGLWSVRLLQPDAPSPYGDREAVAGRTWTTELSLARDGDGIRVAVRVLCASLPFTQAPIVLTRPRVVLDLANSVGLCDVRPVVSTPWRLEQEDDLTEFHDFLVNPDRTLPVFMLTEPDAYRLGVNVRKFLLDETYLARKLQGVGQVVVMPRDLNPVWTMMVDRTWSAFRGAVRTYRPRLNFVEDAPTRHPLALADRILAFERNGRIAEDAFTSFLIGQAFDFAATNATDCSPCLLYPDALQRNAELARTRAKDDGDWKEVYEQEIDALTKRAEEAEGLADSYSDDVDSLKIQLSESDEENRRLSNYIDTLRAQLTAKTGGSADDAIVIPEDYASPPEWVETHLAGRLLLHPRAQRGLKVAAYEDVSLVYRSLLALAQEYRDMRLRTANDDGPKQAWDAKLKDLGLECEGSITRERAGEEGNTYFVKYPHGTTTSQFLDMHLRKGRTKDDRVCLAIYFFWDDETRRVVVGWLPSHLQNRMT